MIAAQAMLATVAKMVMISIFRHVGCLLCVVFCIDCYGAFALLMINGNIGLILSVAVKQKAKQDDKAHQTKGNQGTNQG